MSQLTITCPSCNETFSADQALQNHLKSKEKKYQEEIKVKEKLLKEKFNLDFKLKEKSLEKEAELKAQNESRAKVQALQSKVQEAENSKKEAELKMTATLKQKEQAIESKLKAKEKALEKTSKDAQTKLMATLKTKEKEIENQLKEKALIQEHKRKKEVIELQNKVALAEKNKKQIEAKLTLDLKQKEKIIELKHREKSESDIQKFKDIIAKKDKEKEIGERRAQAKIDEISKQLKQKSMEVQGEVQEELIEDYLRSKFPADTVEEVKKGAKGADCILTINNKDNEKLAQIYFESKDHKTFKEEWVSKLLSDMKDKNINYGVLITTAMPKDYNKQHDGYVERHGKRIMIIPMNYPIIHMLVSFIKANLINEHRSKKDFDAPKMMKRLWDHIMGPSFQLPVRNLYQTMIKMNDLMGKEKKFFENNMANKERAMLDMEEDFRDMIKSFTLKVGPDCVIQIEERK